jgi:hypothetical protein
VSQHVIEDGRVRWIFGWDQKYRSFFLTKLDKTLTNDENPVIQLGTRPREIPDAEGLFTLALMAGLDIPDGVRIQLYRANMQEISYFVLHYPDEFVLGFRTDNLAHAELLKEALSPARPDQELQIRRITEYS